MLSKGVVSQPIYLQNRCPYCTKKLRNLQIMKRKLQKICKCNHCKKIIDERHVVW